MPDNWNETEAAVYLAAMLDGEGHVSGPSSRAKVVTISNDNVAILDRVARCLDLFGIEFGFSEQRKSGGKGGFIRITARRNYMRLLEACGDYIVSGKRERLIRLTAETPEWRRNSRPNYHRDPDGPRPTRRKHDWEAIATARAEGVSISELARRHETSRSHIYKVLRGGDRHS